MWCGSANNLDRSLLGRTSRRKLLLFWERDRLSCPFSVLSWKVVMRLRCFQAISVLMMREICKRWQRQCFDGITDPLYKPWTALLVRILQRNWTHRRWKKICIYLILRNWLMWIWKLRSPMICSLWARDQESQWYKLHPESKGWRPRENQWSSSSRQAEREFSHTVPLSYPGSQ